MPELAEVEIARENLERWMSGRLIIRARVRDPRMVRGGGAVRRIERCLTQARSRGVRRRGKFLLLDFDSPRGERFTVVAHLAMSGRFILWEEPVRAQSSLAPAASLRLDDGREVWFTNPRRLGHFRLMQPDDDARLRRLGIDPLDSAFTGRLLFSLLSKSRRPVKLFLMDQKNLSGLGNIQVAESLFIARLAPTELANRLTPSHASRLRNAIVQSLRRTLRASRAERVRYMREPGAGNPFLVYGRLGEACPRCASAISRTIQAGRTTYFCPHCQPAPDDAGRESSRRKK